MQRQTRKNVFRLSEIDTKYERGKNITRMFELYNIKQGLKRARKKDRKRGREISLKYFIV